jgi:Uncharacterized conserved protein
MKNYLICLVIIAASCTSPINHKTTGAICISDSTRHASCVYLTTDEKDQPIVSWCETNPDSKQKSFYMAWLDEKSGRFSSKIAIPIEQNASLHEEGMPKIAVKNNGAIIAVYETSTPSDYNRFAGSIRYIVSTNKGKSWTNPVYLHADTTPGKSHSFTALARLGDGEIGACWLDAKPNKKIHGRPVRFAKTSGGNSFVNEMVIDSIACECCRIAISGSKNGRVSIVFRDIINDSIRDMSIVTSEDNGNTFSLAVPYSKDGWVINGCPHNGPALAITDNKMYTTWFTGGSQKGVYYCELNTHLKPANRLLVSNQARFIQLCVLEEGSRILAYDEKRKVGDKTFNKIVLNRLIDDRAYAGEIASSGSMASYPVVKAFGKDKVVVAWSQDEKIYYSVVDVESINKPVIKKPSRGVNVAYNPQSAMDDPVCGMKVSATEDTVRYRGNLLGFCSELCKARFLDEPAAYVENH